MKKLIFIIVLLLLSLSENVAAGEVNVLLIGSHSRGIGHWITPGNLAIENYLEFNGIDYTFFDIYANELSQSDLDGHSGVILEGDSINWDTSESEKKLISENMNAGNITVFLTCVNGGYKGLNNNIYSALNVSVTGIANNRDNITLNGAKVIYNYSGEENFVFTGGRNHQHVGLGINCLKYWDYYRWLNDYMDERKYGLVIATEKWMSNAFGVDTRVSIPLISLLNDDIQLQGRGYPRYQSIIDWVDENKHRIRSTGYMVTSVSGHDIGNTTLQSDEEIWSRWGSISLHGYNHQPVGIDDYDFNFSVQNEWMPKGIDTLRKFSRYKPMKSSPMSSWNNATLHTLYENGMYYHVASMRGPQRELYKSNFDVESELERSRMMEREPAGYKFYPLINNNGTDTVRIYSLTRSVTLDADVKYNIMELLKQVGLDRWAPLLIATHYNTEAIKNPTNWMVQMNDLMELVDDDSYLWRRWVDNYDLAKNVKLFETDLTTNGITVNDNVIIYNLTAGKEIKYLTLKAAKEGHTIKSVDIDGSKYNYFGKNYVHLPAINGTTIIKVTLTDQEDIEPHVNHIQPSAVIENAIYSNGLLNLILSGEFVVNIYLDKTHKAFLNGKNIITSDNRVIFQVNASNYPSVQQINLEIVPTSDNITVDISDWTKKYKRWVESSDYDSVSTEHVIGDFNPDTRIDIKVNGKSWNSYMSDATGQVSFTYADGYSEVDFEATQKASIMSFVPIIGIIFLIILFYFLMKRKR